MKLLGTIPLETKRLNLKRITIDDYNEAFTNVFNNSNIAKNTLSKKHVNPIETKNLFEYYEREYINLYTYRWKIELKETNELIGMIEANQNNYTKYDVLELGFCIGENYWNKGYATEAINEVIKFLFDEIDTKTIYAECFENNEACNKVLKKVNMIYEGTLQGRIIDTIGKSININSYSIQNKK